MAGQILWAGKAEKGEVTWPLMTTNGAKFEIGASELSFFKGIAGYLLPSACYAIASYWGTIGRLGEVILMSENLIKLPLIRLFKLRRSYRLIRFKNSVF